MHGNMFYYLELPYGPDGTQLGGFLADSEGNLIDMNGKVLTSVEDMESFIQNNNSFDEFNADTDEKLNGLLIVKIIDKEEKPEQEVGEELNGDEDVAFEETQPEEELQEGEINAFACCKTEVPVCVEKPLYYENPVPTPCFKKKLIPYEVKKFKPVFIKKCVPVHIPVRVPIKVKVDVEVPVQKEFITVCPVEKTVYREVPKYIHQTQIIKEHVPKVCTVRVPEYHYRQVEVAQPYKVVDQIRVHKVHTPAPPSCGCNQ